MAISMESGGSNGGGFRSRRARSGGSLSEINVTPFVDVVLVLLIIFMLTAHVMGFGLEVDVPKTIEVESTPKEMPVVTIPKDGTTFLNGKPVNINELGTTIRGSFGKDVAGVYVRADRTTIWDAIAQVTAVLGKEKFKVYMVTQPLDVSEKSGK